ncbi:MAG: TonB-dependent receptor [Chitinophagaceae bacterium]|nr:TonB-dependent receptor [Chitinophagaceae bacterium]
MRNIIILLSSLLITCYTSAQVPSGGGNRPAGGRSQMAGSFYGKLIEAKSLKPIEYASVQLLQNRFDSATKKRKDVVVAGMLTKTNGEFRLENIPAFGQYKLQVTVVGFKPYEQNVSFDLKPNGGNNGDMTTMMSALDKDLGNIKVDIEDKVLDNVTVTSSNPGLRLGIDRKVFNVDKNLVSAGGTAVDVMRNVPSINVDIDGNVTMRNNSPQIFVDGRPTNMSLDQIPADAIESVEIITNPSAKFDASGGTAGILNVVLKKNKRVGYSGSIRTNLDSRGRLGFGGDINIRQDKVNFFVNANMNQRKSISTGTTDRTTLIGTPNTFLHQTDRSISKGTFMFLRSGFDFFLDNRNTLSITGNIGQGRFKPTSESDILIDSLYSTVTSSFSERLSNSNNKFNNAGAMLSFKHLFPKQGEELTADVTYNKSKNTNLNLVSTDYYKIPGNTFLSSFKQQQNGSGSNDNIVIQTDYTKPITEKSKLEMGLRAQFRTVDNRNDFFVVNSAGSLVYDPLLSVNYTSTDNIYAAYTTYSNQIKDFGYQLGLRVESSDYEGILPDKDQAFNIKFPVSLFPSVFLTQKLKNNQDLQLNYSRKINRPNFFQLYPFTDYSDSLNISRGNPNLSPEFTNSLELSYQKTFKNKDNFIASAYYKNTTDLITRYQEKEINASNGKDMLVNTYINASSSYVTGLELVSKNKMTKWWDMTTNLNLFTSKINLDDPTQPEQDQFASWFGKLNNTFKLPKNFSLQLSGEYQSKTILPPGGSGSSGGGGGRGGGMFGGGGGMFGQASASQGYVKANYYVDAGIRFEFLKNKQASLSLNVNDIFRTRRQNIYSESAYFVQEVFRRRDPQILRLNFNWRFGKFDPNLFKRKNNKNQGDGTENMNMGQ